MYMTPFESIVTTTKRNHRYYGPTESAKIKSTMSEIVTDLRTIFNEYDRIRASLDVLASGYLTPSGNALLNNMHNNLYDMRRQFYNIENRMGQIMFLGAEQAKTT